MLFGYSFLRLCFYMEKSEMTKSRNETFDPLKSYVIGFVLSVLLTIVAYIVATGDSGSRGILVAIIMTLAVIQLLIQLVFFLHLGDERKPRLNLTTFVFAVIVLVTIVFGTLWIMDHLNYHMLSDDVDRHIMEEEAIYR